LLAKCPRQAGKKNLRFSRALARINLMSQRAKRVVGKPSRGSHNGAAILHPNTKVLDFGGLFVFLGAKNITLSSLHLFLNLWGLNLQHLVLKCFIFYDIINKRFFNYKFWRIIYDDQAK
jgi:hypothetical protein